MSPPKVRESNAQKQNRLRTQEENVRAVQENVSDRTNSFVRRLRGRRSLITGAVTRRAG